MSAPTILACRVALSRDPENAGIMELLAGRLLDAGRTAEAEPLLRSLAERLPERHEFHTALGNVLRSTGRFPEAEAAYRRALALAGEDLPARYNLAILTLLQGRLREGWEGRELRWRAGGVRPRTFPEPEWDGGALQGRTLLLHGAQEGLGDALMGLRYAAEARARGGRVLAEVHPSLVEVVRTCPFLDGVIPFGEPLPPFQVQALLMSMPRILGTDLATIPWPGPYLQSPGPPAALGGARRIGLVHAGNPGHPDDLQRSIPVETFEHLAPLVPACSFFSLQKHRDPALPPLPSALEARDLGGALEDFAATARILAALDLLVTVDTSVAHLAGAMGLEVRLLLPFEPDWRWMLDRTDSPWYPSFRLYRQPSPGDWDSVLRALAGDLAHGS